MVVRAPVLWVPLEAFAPANMPPVPMHAVALVELQVSVEDPPLAIGIGLAVSVAVGTGLAVTVTVAAAAVLVPPVPVQVSEYVVSVVKAPVLWLPPVANAPVQPPEALQDVVFVELQVSIAAPPLLTMVGDADIDAVGAGGTVVTGTDPDPDPPQAARSSVAPIAIAGAKQRIRVFSNFRIILGAAPHQASSPQQNLLIHRSVDEGPLVNITSALSSATQVSFHGIQRRGQNARLTYVNA